MKNIVIALLLSLLFIPTAKSADIMNGQQNYYASPQVQNGYVQTSQPQTVYVPVVQGQQYYYAQPQGNPYAADIQAMKYQMEYANTKNQYDSVMHTNPNAQAIQSINDNTALELAKNNYKATKSAGRAITTREIRDVSLTTRDVLHTTDNAVNTISRIRSFANGASTWSNWFPNY